MFFGVMKEARTQIRVDSSAIVDATSIGNGPSEKYSRKSSVGSVCSLVGDGRGVSREHWIP